jgi:PTS system fructose-specific IIA component
MSDFVKASHVFLDNPATSCDEALAFLSDKAEELGIGTDAASILDAFKAREAEGSTGMMGGFAIPHAKSTAIDVASVEVVKFSGDLDWTTMDDKPIRVAIALLIPDSEAGTTHLKLLSKVAVMLMHEDFCKSVLASDDPDQIAGIINEGLDK